MDELYLVTVSVACRKDYANGALNAMLDASNNLSIYGFDCDQRPLTVEEKAEVKMMVPEDALKGLEI